MCSRKYTFPLAFFLGVAAMCGHVAGAEQDAVEDAWKTLPTYEYGQDMATLLKIDGAVIDAMATPESRESCAARLARVLTSDQTTLAARHYICLKLREIGTRNEVPVLAKMLAEPDTSEMARQALQVIPAPEAGKALRESLATLEGELLVGAINSVAARKDVDAVSELKRLSASEDQHVAEAALWALGNIPDQDAASFLLACFSSASLPTPRKLAVPLLRSAAYLKDTGNIASAKSIYTQLSREAQCTGVRRAALEGLLQLESEQLSSTVLSWLADSDSDTMRQTVALGHLHALSPEQLDQLLKRLEKLSPSTQMAVIELAAPQRGQTVVSVLKSMVNSEELEIKLAGIRNLGTVGDASAIPLLVELLGEDERVCAAAQQALLALPEQEVTSALLDALQGRPRIREPVIAVLVKLKCYDAIDPLIEIASQPDPATYQPALTGLRGIADPDKTDIPRLVKLLLGTDPGQHRDDVEKTILIVTEKLAQDADRSQLVREALGPVPESESHKYLPLLGRLGGPQSLEIIQSALESTDPTRRRAAVRALCNWPDASVADQLLDIASNNQDETFCRWALRAYVRVVALESDREPAETLSMLQNAMTLCEVVDDKRLVIERAATVRTMDTVNWIAPYLDDPELNQAACHAIVELAHHRFLRHPNMSVFGPLLEQVGRVCKDPSLVERARRYRLGL